MSDSIHPDFSVRGLLLLTALVAVTVGWSVDRRSTNDQLRELTDRCEVLDNLLE